MRVSWSCLPCLQLLKLCGHLCAFCLVFSVCFFVSTWLCIIGILFFHVHTCCCVIEIFQKHPLLLDDGSTGHRNRLCCVHFSRLSGTILSWVIHLFAHQSKMFAPLWLGFSLLSVGGGSALSSSIHGGCRFPWAASLVFLQSPTNVSITRREPPETHFRHINFTSLSASILWDRNIRAVPSAVRCPRCVRIR